MARLIVKMQGRQRDLDLIVAALGGSNEAAIAQIKNYITSTTKEYRRNLKDTETQAAVQAALDAKQAQILAEEQSVTTALDGVNLTIEAEA